MDAKLKYVFYSPNGFWKGHAPVRKLAKAAKVPEDAAKNG